MNNAYIIREAVPDDAEKMSITYIIREAVPDDAEKMIVYLNQVGGGIR